LKEDDFRFILEGCDYPVEMLSNKKFSSSLNPKGFWRVDKELEPELRQTVLSLVAFADLEKAIAAKGGNEQAGIEAFLNMNDGDGWMFPENLCLADYGLGHDERAKTPQCVASRLGARFYDWQLAQPPEEFQRECAVHAANLTLGRASSLKDATQENDANSKNNPSSQMEFDF
jgi:hypothetical protein